MATYVLPPGAWLSGELIPGIGGNSALIPGIGGNSPLIPGIGGNSRLIPGIGGNSPLIPGIGGNSPLIPGIGGNSPLIPGIGRRSAWNPAIGEGLPADRLAAAAARLAVATPWRGEVPEWAYDTEAQALLSVALNRTQARLVRATDPRREARKAPVVAPRRDDVAANATLWRWGSEPRILAVLADLNWRFAVSGACLWYLIRNSADGRQVTFEPSISFKAVPNSDAWYATQVDKVLRAAIQREERLPEILSQAEDFGAFFWRQVGLDPTMAPITAEVLAIAQRWATPLVLAMKNQIAARRPDAASSRVVPVIPTPPHGSLPSGHATISALLSRVLGMLAYGKQGLDHPKVVQLDRLARRIAFNRVVAGVHFPIDSRAGHALGLQMAAHFIGLAMRTPQPKEFSIDFESPKEVELREEGRPQPVKLRPARKAKLGVDRSRPLTQVWNAACRELRHLGFDGVPT